MPTIEERIYREIPAMLPKAPIDTGKMMCLATSRILPNRLKYSKSRDFIPDTGSHPKLIPKKLIKSKASQNSGTENPTKAKTVVALSINEFLLTAERIPSGMPTASIKIKDETLIK